MPRWSNWSGRHRTKPSVLHFVRSERDAAALLQEAARAGVSVRAAGAGHSHAPLIPGADIIVDTSGLAGVMAADTERRRVRVRSGTPIHALGRPLHDAGLALINQGDIDRQTIGGACATGTHGTGAALTNLSAAVQGVRLALPSGDIVECGPERDPALWQATRLNLGALGIVTELVLEVRECYRLAERSWTEPYATLMPRLPELITASRHFEFFWYPDRDVAVLKAIEETDADPEYPLAAEGQRCAWSYEVLPNHRPLPHTEMEYAVPAERGAACFAAIRALIRRQFPDLRWPVEYRTQAADDVWLSPAYQRAVVTLSVHQDVREDEEPYFRACEEIFLEHGGRPHWGKLHYLDGARLAAMHPRWADWWAVRDRADPAGTLLNDWLRRLRDSAFRV